MNGPACVEAVDGGLRLHVHVTPRAGRDAVLGLHGGRIRIRVGSPPVEGRANRRLIEFIAREFRVGRTQVRLVSGERGRDKCVHISNPRATPAWLADLMTG